MNNRRAFIKYLGLGSLALGINQIALKAGSLKAFSDKNIPTFEGDWNMLRQQFLLEKDRIYLNNGTMGISPLSVLNETIEKMLYADETGTYGGGEEEICSALAGFLNANQNEITLTHNITEGTNNVLNGLDFKKGDHIICTTHEHVGTLIPLLHLAQKEKLNIKAVPIDIGPEKTTDNILNAINSKTRLICVPHMPCTIGQLLDVKKICQEAAKRNILTLIDGAHPPGMVKVDMKNIGCDFYVGCGHKWMLAPRGTGFIYMKNESRDKVKSIFVGAGTHAGGNLSNLKSDPIIPVNTGHRYYYGSQNAALYFGWVQALSFLGENIGMEKVEKRTKYLSRYLRNRLETKFPDIQFFCPESELFRTAVTAFKFPGIDMGKLSIKLRDKKIIVRHVHENKLDLIRVSTHIYNNEDDCERLIEGMIRG